MSFVYARVDKQHILGIMTVEKNIKNSQAPVRVSVSEAARLFGISPRTVRRAITLKEITYIIFQGRYKINFESLIKWSQSSSTIRNKRDRAGIGQFVEQWKIKNTLYSPGPESVVRRLRHHGKIESEKPNQNK